MKFKSFVIEAKDGRQVPAEIGRLKVPERRDIDAVRQITISCVRLPRRQATDLAPVVFLAGGPGESAIHVASGRLLEAFEHVQEITDVILLDVRGVGHSHPNPEYVDVAPSEALFESRNSILEHLIAEAQATVAASRESGLDLHGYHAIEMAHDLRDLRDALGVQALTLWGYSFGSHLAMAVARYHRDVAGALILSGVEGPNHTHKLPANVNTHLERLARLIAAAPTGTRVPDFIGLMNEVHERLDRERPQVTMTLTSGGQPARYQICPFAAQYATWRAMTNRRAYRLVPFQYARAAEGDYELLAKSIEVQWRRRPRSPVYYLSDSASGATRERLHEIRAQAASCVLADAASFPFPMIDEAYETRDLGDEFREPPAFDGPTLMISGSLDSNTPPHQAEALQLGFPTATHIIVENAGHNELISTPKEYEAITEIVAGAMPHSHIVALEAPDFA